MKKAIAVLAATIALVLGGLVLAAPVQAAAAPERYRGCAKLQKDFPSGVAQSGAAARRAYADGFRRPAVRRGAYRANKRLDRDGDRVACERRRPKPETPAPPAPPVPPEDPWMHLTPTAPLEVMDFGNGTSLKVGGWTFFDHDDVYLTETPQLSDGTPLSGSDGEYYTRPYPTKLVHGKNYDFTLTVGTPAHWSCSVYNKEGCSWVERTTDVLVWNFTYSSETPGRIYEATKVSWKRLYHD